MHRISLVRYGNGSQQPTLQYGITCMKSRIASLFLIVCLGGAFPARAATEATLFRLFLRDGNSVVSFGEFARLDDQVVFSMPVGGPADQPRLHVVSLPSSEVDWARTDRYAAAARYQRYAETRGEEDFQLLSSDVARVLNEVAYSTDKAAALAAAEQARQTLADWPSKHFGYRERDVREVVALLDEAISDLKASAGRSDFALSLVAMPEETKYEPVMGMPTLVEEIDDTFRVAKLMSRVSDKVALLQEVLALVKEAGPTLSDNASNRLRHLAEDEIRRESDIDQRYDAMSKRLLSSATKAAGQARIADVERVVKQLPKEDARLGGKRPEVVQALSASLRTQLESARHFQLMLDQWQVRRASNRAYQKAVGVQLLQLVKIEPSLEAIRKLSGPRPTALLTLKGRLDGGADRLQRMVVPDHLRATHELLVSAWRFAETAVDVRYSAVSSGNVAVALQASSSAAGALLMVERVKSETRALLEPPRLQ